MSEAVRKVIIKKVKKKHGEGHHGGSWKVAYADFVTAMMAFFLLLWLLSMVSTEKRAVMAEYFKNFSLFKESGKTFQPGSAFVIADHIKKAELKPENVAMSLKKALGRKGAGQQGKAPGTGQEEALMEHLRVDAVDGGVRIQIIDREGSPMFQLGSAEPTVKCREIIAAVAEVIREQDARIAVEGHTDAAPFRGDQITNWELSTNRASSARRMLEASGLDPARVARVVGYADTDLLVKENPKDPQNRRISIILLQPGDGGTALAELKREVQGSMQPQMPAPVAVQQAPADEAPDKEQSARQALQEKKAAMKKK
ncbi:MAG TPA: flagellar motor protein MotB, partial [Deltaproteobacteria bacterium]|nr:flagellar motor protein MotB [Deltaproteobacteria bacterium]